MLSMQILNFLYLAEGGCKLNRFLIVYTLPERRYKFNAFNADSQLFIPRLREGVNLMISMQIFNCLYPT